MSAASVCVSRTWKTGGCAVDVCLRFTDAPGSSSRRLFCREAAPTLPALCSRLPASKLLSPLLCQRGWTDRRHKARRSNYYYFSLAV